MKKIFQVIVRRWSPITVSIALIAGMGVAGGAFKPTSKLDQEGVATVLPVETLTVRREDSYRVRRNYLGRLESSRQSQLSFELAGKIINVLVDEGDVVKQGQILAELDTQILRSQYESLQAQVRAAKAKLDELVAGPRSETIDAARSEVDNWQAELRLSQVTTERRKSLVESRSISSQEYDDALFHQQAVDARLKKSQSQLRELVNGTRSEQITAQRALWQRLQADLRTIEVQIGKSKLIAPFAGTVFRRHLDEGVVVTAGQVVLEVFDQENLEARIGLPSRLVPQITQGPYTIRDQGIDRTARLKTIRPYKNSTTRTDDLLFEFPAVDSVTLGEVVELRLDQKVQQPGFWIPTPSLVENYRGLWGCFVFDDSNPDDSSKARLRELELIHQSGDLAYVRGAIGTGDRVITSGVHRLVANQAVRTTNVNSIVETDVRSRPQP